MLDFFSAIMPLCRFQDITAAIRFDNWASRRLERSTDRFAPIRELWDKWSGRLDMLYNPSDCVTIDEQLIGFRGRCKFKIYMPSKPCKYGIKFWILVDTVSGYVLRIQPYLGEGNVVEKEQGKRVVLDLVRGLKGKNVTADNFFTSHSLGQELLRHNLTYVGTVRQNKRCIPPELKTTKNRFYT